MRHVPWIIAHRGASAHAPENTLAAFQMAIEAGADGIEFDVRLAADGVPVVIHDANLERTGMRHGVVAEMKSKELGELEVGSWFNAKFPKKASPAFANETVPTLESSLKLFEKFDGMIYIELKGDRDFRALARAVCSEIENSSLLPRIIVKSFKLALIPEIRHHLPDVATAALFSPDIMKFLRRRRHILAAARQFGASQISLHKSLVTRSLMDRANLANIPVTVWTADNPRWINRCRNLGIGALITNDPGKMIAAQMDWIIGSL